jgi:hypothetical protein
MTITLITPEEYNNLLTIHQRYPALTFQNIGYQYIDKSKLTEEESTKFKEVNDFLATKIKGFSEFNNFKLTKTGEVVLRFQYNWTADEEKPSISYIGVGYLLLDELLSGFRPENR